MAESIDFRLSYCVPRNLFEGILLLVVHLDNSSMAPSITDFFGAGAVVDASTPSNPKLTITFADFAAQGFTDTTKANDAEGWATALLKKWRAFTLAAGTDETANLTVDAPFVGTTTRNSLPKREYSYSARVYEPDLGASEPSPNNV